MTAEEGSQEDRGSRAGLGHIFQLQAGCAIPELLLSVKSQMVIFEVPSGFASAVFQLAKRMLHCLVVGDSVDTKGVAEQVRRELGEVRFPYND